MTGTRRIRASGLLVVVATAWYLPWAFGAANLDAAWIAVPFLAASVLLTVGLLVSVVNNWHRAVPLTRLVREGDEPRVAVVVTSAGEPPEQIEQTATSVVEQDWPSDRLTLVLSDDAADPQVEAIAARLASEHPDAEILYFHPPERGTEARRGDAKAGNLNGVLDLLAGRPDQIEFVETRDADDVVGDSSFVRQTLGQLRADDRVAFVQTIKEAVTSEGDPFDALQPHFYRGSMFARHAANAVFPCGSGLVWRRAALDDIGGFPTWNLVEDLQSGLEAQARGWRTCYLPIVGARAQHAPEDIPNVYQQRGTWALDTMRLFFWRRFPGLTLRQRLHFWELPLFYLQSSSAFVFILAPVAGFALDVYPLVTDIQPYALHFWPYAISVELFLVALNGRQPYEALWHARIMWVGLVPVYLRACLQAVVDGPTDKPRYRVTRKVDRFAWYWRETLPQTVLLAALTLSTAYSAATQPLFTEFDLGSALWAVFFSLILAGFVRRSRFGVRETPVRMAAGAASNEPLTAPGPGRSNAR